MLFCIHSSLTHCQYIISKYDHNYAKKTHGSLNPVVAVLTVKKAFLWPGLSLS